jgi:hypothetical protein
MRTVKFANKYSIALRTADRQVGLCSGRKVTAKAPNCRKYLIATEYRTKIITNGKLRYGHTVA